MPSLLPFGCWNTACWCKAARAAAAVGRRNRRCFVFALPDWTALVPPLLSCLLHFDGPFAAGYLFAVACLHSPHGLSRGRVLATTGLPSVTRVILRWAELGIRPCLWRLFGLPYLCCGDATIPAWEIPDAYGEGVDGCRCRCVFRLPGHAMPRCICRASSVLSAWVERPLALCLLPACRCVHPACLANYSSSHCLPY